MDERCEICGDVHEDVWAWLDDPEPEDASLCEICGDVHAE